MKLLSVPTSSFPSIAKCGLVVICLLVSGNAADADSHLFRGLSAPISSMETASEQSSPSYRYKAFVDMGRAIPNEHLAIDYGSQNTAQGAGTLNIMSRSPAEDGARIRSSRRLKGAFRVSGKVKAAAAANRQSTSGILTTLYTSTLEGSGRQNEIDFEFLGKDPFHVQTNYYVKGVGGKEKVHYLGFDTRDDFHTYTLEVTSQSIRWYADGQLIREEIGLDLIKEPTYLYSSVWDGGKVLPDWAGPTEWKNGPFMASYRELTMEAEDVE